MTATKAAFVNKTFEMSYKENGFIVVLLLLSIKFDCIRYKCFIRFLPMLFYLNNKMLAIIIYIDSLKYNRQLSIFKTLYSQTKINTFKYTTSGFSYDYKTKTTPNTILMQVPHY